MDFKRYLIEKIFRPLYFFKEGQNWGPIQKYLADSQYFPDEKLKEIQLENLKALVKYASEHCRYYHDLFESWGISSSAINSLSDLEKIPILGKEDIRNSLDLMISDEFERDRLYPIRTGGSTGYPLKLFSDSHGMEFRQCVALRHDFWAGYSPGKKLAAIWGDTDKKYTFKEKLRNALLQRTIYLDTLKMNREYMLGFVKRVRKFKPKYMMGHSHSIYMLACFVEKNKIDILDLEGIITTAEMLYDNERKKIEAVFGNVVYNRYGCEEVGLIASECERHDGLHINADGLIVEAVGATETEPGRLIITDLKNHAVPLIRYEIGDLATVRNDPCACGRGLPRLGKITGRTSDFLYTPDGRMISGISILDTYVIHIEGFDQVQIVQNKIDELDFNIVKSDNFTGKSVEILKETIQKVFGAPMKCNINYVDEIPATARGKFRFTVCNIDEPGR
nr:phenylacetate--CoA ligase family protein [candidate division Zixibacteria bacterium]